MSVILTEKGKLLTFLIILIIDFSPLIIGLESVLITNSNSRDYSAIPFSTLED